MPSREEVAYFGAGPAPLPTPVLETSAKALLNFEDTGLSLAEISHRSPTANKIIADAKEALSQLLEVPDSYDIIFLQGGGSGEFSASVQNMVGAWIERRRRKAIADLGGEGTAEEDDVVAQVKKDIESDLKVDYLVTGSWSLKASQEGARLISPRFVNVAVDARKHSRDGKFTTIPDESQWKLSSKSAMTYFCDNETVDGVEFPAFPKSLEGNEGSDEVNETIVVADMSSNFLSRRVDVKKYGVIFVCSLFLSPPFLSPS
jgi:phosphoserine aminotransferase